jgi:hypothetical protein
LPKNLLIARLQPVAIPSVQVLADRFQLDIKVPGEINVAPDRSFRVTEEDRTIAFGGDGSLEVKITKPNLDNRTQIATRQAVSLAQETVRRYGLEEQGRLVFDRALLLSEGGGTSDGSGQLEGPFTTGTIVQFRQVINGLPVITPSAGTVRVALDNDGTVTGVHSSVRSVEKLSDRPMSTTPTPTAEGMIATPQAPSPADYEQRLAAGFSRQLAAWVVKGRVPVEFTTVPGSTEIGYDIRGDEAVLIARKAVEVDFGNGYRKRYWVTTPLFE